MLKNTTPNEPGPLQQPPQHPSSSIAGSEPSIVRSRRASILLGATLILFAFNLRLIFPSLSVLLPEIIHRTGLSATAASYLTSLPVWCMGIFAPLAPPLARRFGMERTLLGVLILIAAGTLLRGSIGISGLFLGSALAGASIAISNVLLPALVKRDFALHIALVTALYSVAMNLGESLAAAVTLPVAHAFGDSWRVGIAAWAFPPALAILVWLPRLRAKAPDRSGPGVPRVRGLWSKGLAWQVTFFMGLQSAMAYCVTGWLAPILRSRGMDGTTAGVVTSVCILVTGLGSLIVPPMVARCKDQRRINVAFAALAGVPLFGLLFAPLSTVWFWAVLQGIGQGGMFTIALTVIALRSPDSRVAAQLSSMAQTIGYIIAGIGPLLVGLLFSWTGGFAASGWLFAALALGGALNGWGAGRKLYVKTD
jgi:CP family cyanate transporter-like MFS transporter